MQFIFVMMLAMIGGSILVELVLPESVKQRLGSVICWMLLATTMTSLGLCSLVLLYVVVIMVGFPYVALMPAFIEHELGREAEAYAVLSLISAAGALAASLGVARYADHPLATTLFGSIAWRCRRPPRRRPARTPRRFPAPAPGRAARPRSPDR